MAGQTTSEEQRIKDNLSRAGTRLIGFARTNLFKRLESSGHSFLLSISRHILRNYLFVYAIDKQLPFPIGKQEAGLIDNFLYTDQEDDDKTIGLSTSHEDYLRQAEDYYASLHNQQSRYRWIRSELFNDVLKKSTH